MSVNDCPSKTHATPKPPPARSAAEGSTDVTDGRPSTSVTPAPTRLQLWRRAAGHRVFVASWEAEVGDSHAMVGAVAAAEARGRGSYELWPNNMQYPLPVLRVRVLKTCTKATQPSGAAYPLLSRLQLQVLAQLGREGHRTTEAISLATGRKPGPVTRALRELAGMRLARTGDAETLWTVSPAGRRRLDLESPRLAAAPNPAAAPAQESA